jgi:hypothetical protein
MNIVVVTLIFLGCWVWGAVSMVRYHRAHQTNPNQPPAQGNPRPVVFAGDLPLTESDTGSSPWSALDDKQLTRLLRDAAA